MAFLNLIIALYFFNLICYVFECMSNAVFKKTIVYARDNLLNIHINLCLNYIFE